MTKTPRPTRRQVREVRHALGVAFGLGAGRASEKILSGGANASGQKSTINPLKATPMPVRPPPTQVKETASQPRTCETESLL
jgi:hypothetical protein